MMINKKKAAALAAGFLLMSGAFPAAERIFAAQEATVTANQEQGGRLDDLTDETVADIYKNTFYGEEGCMLILPQGYVPSESVQGLYLSERHPLDSSNIYYTVSRHRDQGLLDAAIASEDYRLKMQEGFREAYGADAQITAYSMEQSVTDGCPTYKITLACEADGMEMQQLIYMVAGDSLYTITYSQSADDGRMEDFEKSAATIRVMGKN